MLFRIGIGLILALAALVAAGWYLGWDFSDSFVIRKSPEAIEAVLAGFQKKTGGFLVEDGGIEGLKESFDDIFHDKAEEALSAVADVKKSLADVALEKKKQVIGLIAKELGIETDKDCY